MVKASIAKAERKALPTLILGFLAGAYIAFAGIVATMVTHDASQYIGYGLAKFFSGLIFSVALILVIVAGAELFTGNNLMIMAWLRRKISASGLLRNWLLVYISNFLGALFVAWLMYHSGLWQVNQGLTGAAAVSIAQAKVSMTFIQAVIRGVLANWLVCLAVWVAYSALDLSGKILGIAFAITTFVASGFEHSIANMYFIPTGIFLGGPGLTWSEFFAANLLPVTLGNIIGGAVLVGMLYWFVYNREEHGQED